MPNYKAMFCSAWRRNSSSRLELIDYFFFLATATVRVAFLGSTLGASKHVW